MIINKKSTKEKHFPFTRICIAFFIGLAILLGTSNSFFSCIAFALLILIIVLFSEEEALCFLMFVMPFANIFKLSAVSQSFFTYLLLFYVFYCFFKKRRIKRNFVLAFLILLCFLMIQMFISINVLRTIKFVANLLFICFALDSQVENNENVFLFFILGIAASSSVAALNLIPNLGDYIGSQSLGLQYDFLFRFAGMYADPNYYSINVIIALCLIVVLYHSKKISFAVSVGLAILMVIFAIMTFSKSAFLMLFLPLTLLLYSKVKEKKYFLFFTIIVLLLIILFTSNIFDTVLSRFDEADDVYSLTTGRSALWMKYVRHLLSSPLILLFGSGFGASLLDASAAHNTYLDLLYYLGVLGSVLLVMVFKVFANVKKSSPKKNLLNYSVWICILIMYFFLSELFYFDWAFHVLLAILVCKTEVAQNQIVEVKEEHK